MEIYKPAEDSIFFSDFLKNYFTTYSPINNLKILDMGTGTGILAKTSAKFLSPKNITAIDINPNAIKALQKEKFKAIQSNLFEVLEKRKPSIVTSSQSLQKINNVKFDLIIFNAPYLPLDSRESKSSQIATTGGKRGDEISIKFLKQAKQYLNKNGKIFLLISSLTPMNKIKKFKPKILTRKKLFMEELLILEFK